MRKVVTLPASSPYMTVRQAAALVGVTEQHIYNQCKSGRIKSVKVGNVVRINRAAFLKQIGLTENDYRQWNLNQSNIG